MEEVRETAEELGIEPVLAAALLKLGWLARAKGDLKRSEKLFREALRITSSRGDRGLEPDYQAALATTLAELGKIDEAERLALDARAHAVPEDTSCQIFALTALAIDPRRAGTRRRGRGAVPLGHRRSRASRTCGSSSCIRSSTWSSFLRDRGRDDDAAAYEARIAELLPRRASSTERIA